MKTYWNISGKLNTIKEWQPNCWIQVTCPTEQEQQELEETFNIPDYFLSDISDTDERARYEYDDGWMLIILRIPYVKEIRSRTPYTTVPLGIIHKRDVTITVCNFETNMMLDFVSFQQKRGAGFTDYVDMIFRLFLCSAVWYLKRLKQISSLIDKAKHNLDKEVNNESLIGLSRLQDSLTYFVMELAYDVIFVVLVIFGYNRLGLEGAGMALTASYMLDLAMVYAVYRKIYGYAFSANTLKIIIVQFCTIAIALATFISGYGFIQYILGTILFALSLLFSIRKLNLTWNQIKQTFARRMQRK